MDISRDRECSIKKGSFFFKGYFFRGEKIWGSLYYPEGQLQYQGQFRNDQYDGKGILYRTDGSVEHAGKWKDGDYH